MSDELGRAVRSADAFKRSHVRLGLAAADARARRVEVNQAAKAQRSQIEVDKRYAFIDADKPNPRPQDF